MSELLSLLAAVGGLARVYVTHGVLRDAAAIAASLFLIVLSSVLLGAALPFALARAGLDPAHAGSSIQVCVCCVSWPKREIRRDGMHVITYIQRNMCSTEEMLSFSKNPGDSEHHVRMLCSIRQKEEETKQKREILSETLQLQTGGHGRIGEWVYNVHMRAFSCKELISASFTCRRW